MIDRDYLEQVFGSVEIEQLAGGPDGDAAADSRVDDAIALATDEANSRLSPRYSTPITNAPREVQEHVAHLARARLYPTSLPEYVAEQRTQARSYLDQAASGRREILGLTPRNRGRVSIYGKRGRRDRDMTRESLEGM